MRINIKMILFILLAGFALNVVNCNVVASYARGGGSWGGRSWGGRSWGWGRPYWGWPYWGWPYWGWPYPWLEIGVIVPVLPFEFETLTFGPGIVYYYNDGVYYKAVPEGYVVVPKSEVEKYKQQKETLKNEESNKNVSGEEYVINIPNSDGSFTPVKLKKSDNGYIGPQGESYQGHPSIEQLKVLYGK
jgi:hypothetical protein